MKARLPKGMGGGPQNMQGLMRQAQKMQEDMAQAKDELAAKEYEIKAGGGMVTLIINGEKEIKNLEIAPEIVDPDDIETLSDILTAAFNEAVKRVDADAEEVMGQITGGMGMNIPGLF
ncbi:MAG: YbaB/EbfC family nucleoid-associated protein [Clostridia bacterium]|nr:YbaB/EbfC family nucleoid-associated protein [Clostridia bacterium]